MEKFIFLYRGKDGGHGELSPDQMQKHMQKWMAWMGGLAAKGIMGASEPLKPTGKQVTGTKKVITDGPFVEAKEMVGGFTVVNAKDIDEAVELAKGCPIFEVGGKLEVRPLQKMEM
ncbi:MAG TPA: YciI family protein [Bacteroidia bacterium]|nr:YciI family protein [Bacteroidia bacterium]